MQGEETQPEEAHELEEPGTPEPEVSPQAAVPASVPAEAAEDTSEAEELASDMEPEAVGPDGVEEPALLTEPKEPEEAVVSEPMEAGVAGDMIGAAELYGDTEPETAGPEGAEEPAALAEPEELESVGTEDFQSPESGESQELAIVVPEQSEDVEETPDGSDTGVEEAQAAEALAVEDPELAATEA
jgi:hypothetical protein